MLRLVCFQANYELAKIEACIDRFVSHRCNPIIYAVEKFERGLFFGIERIKRNTSDTWMSWRAGDWFVVVIHRKKDRWKTGNTQGYVARGGFTFKDHNSGPDFDLYTRRKYTTDCVEFVGSGMSCPEITADKETRFYG